MHGKKIIFIVLFSLFGFVPGAYGQEITPSVIPSSTPVSYTLPYPGILPGHPLYGLKSFRDACMDFLISNPLKKAEYALLQADKELQATLLLLENKKDDKLIITTLITAENDFEKAILKAQEAKKQGLITEDLLIRLSVSNKKHQEVIAEIVKTTNGRVKEEAGEQLRRSQEFAKTVSQQDSQ